MIENAPSDPVRRLGDWLRAAGLDLSVVRPFDGDPLPDTFDGHAALVVLGGPQRLHGDPGGAGASWLADERALLRRAVADRVPTLAICLGAQLLAQAHGGTVAAAVAGPELGPKLVARRDAADHDPLFAAVPFTPDVIQWHFDEIVELPPGAELLATSTRYAHQAFRIGPRAWATQFHIEPDAEMVTAWARKDAPHLVELGLDPRAVAEAAVAALDEVAQVWRPFAERFAGLALGTLRPDAATDPARRLSILGE
ncbi:MAG: type 1 glutamine amidotransferase [Micromonosporaceae bacterium]|nr:type 1 glutamine amidotransferase [Micromonosporaceae bacterium]